jgi:hemerythrin
MEINKEFTNTGIPLIDDQHKKFLKTAEDLYLAPEIKELTRQYIKDKLDEMNIFIIEHFDAEEYLMRSINFPEYDYHVECHRTFGDLINSFIEDADSFIDTETFIINFRDTVANHINDVLVKIDNDIAVFIKENNIKI